MGSHKRIPHREVALYELYFRINNLAALCGRRKNCWGGAERGSRKASEKATRVQEEMRECQVKGDVGVGIRFFNLF